MSEQKPFNEPQFTDDIEEDAVVDTTRLASQRLNELVDAITVGALPSALLGDQELIDVARGIEIHDVITEWREDHIESIAVMLEIDSTVRVNQDILLLETLWQFCETVEWLQNDLRQFILEMSGRA